MKETPDYDSPWKEVIELYFKEFIEFFFPKAFNDIDWNKGYEFLDKEMQQITKEAKTGRKYVDKLVRVRLNTGKDIWVVIHADVQTQREKDSLFWEELKLIEKEEKMQYITSVERIGYKKGMQEGIQKGIQKGTQEGIQLGQIQLIARQIAKRFNSQEQKEMQKLKKLEAPDLTELGEKLFEFVSLKEIHDWIKNKVLS
jgi:flagellar biosynthesis/type III secretory pathway protein FliH